MSAIAQNNYSSTEEMADGANTLFEQEEYIQAFPLYSQLLSLDRDNPELNYRFGVCLLFSDRSDTYAPITYLKKALNHVTEPEIYYYLGFAYHINYYFPAAISFYQDYKQKAGRKLKKSFDVDRKIEMCQNGIAMMRSVKDLFVLQKSEVSRAEFFRSYDLHDLGSRMISKPEMFLSKEDQRKKEKDFIFFNTKAAWVYYSGYSNTNKNQKDIFRRFKLPESGEWSKAEKLPETINTPYDEDYPVMMPDGKTLYFSSKGHNTIGGYDIFKSVFNPQSQQWSEPVNINFPFNTPVDDILFVSDSLESTAWFASVRNSVSDKIMVYKVGIIKRPEGSADLAAIYAKNRELTEADLKQIKDRARLDVNISSKDYEDIPEPVIDGSVAASQSVHQASEDDVHAKIQEKQQEQLIIDSAKMLVDQLEKNIYAFDSIRQDALSMAAKKKLEAHRIREDVKHNMKLLAQSIEKSAYQKVVDESNRDLARAERLEYEASELEHFAKATKDKIDDQRLIFASINQQYGDAEGAVIQGDHEKARQIISQMDHRLQQLPQIRDMRLVFDKDEGGLQNIQYPDDLANPDTFVAFTLSTGAALPQITAQDSKYDDFIPQAKKEETPIDETAFSSDPSERVTEYLQLMQASAASLDIQISDYQNDIDQMISGFNQLPDEEKIRQIALLNESLKAQRAIEAQAKYIRQKANVIQNDYQKIVLSSASPDLKVESYRNMATEAEKNFDFDKKVLTEVARASSLALIAPADQYQINADGQLERQAVGAADIVASSQLKFQAEDAEKIQHQAIQMLSHARAQLKRNAFGMQKVQRKIDRLDLESKQDFEKAGVSIQAARKEVGVKRTALVSQANSYFAIAEAKAQELKNYQDILGQMNSANEDGQAVIAQLSQDVEQVNQAVEQENWAEVKDKYLNAEKTYFNQRMMLDFSDQIDMNQVQLIHPPSSAPQANFVAYQVAANGDIVKTIGNPAEDWSSFQNFSDDVTAENSKRNLVIDPQVKLGSTQESYTNIFEPESLADGGAIDIAEIQFPETIAHSDQSLINNTRDQVENIQLESHLLANKRNAVHKYYQDMLQRADDLEKQSLMVLQGNAMNMDDVAKANTLNKESKKALWKAAQAAALIQQYDVAIENNIHLISEGQSVLNQMNENIQNNKEDEALLLNVQFQRKLSDQSVSSISDSQFNFALGELFVETPSVFDSAANQEFVVNDGQIQRNPQPQLHTYFYQHTTKQKTALAKSSMIIPASVVLAAGTNNSANGEGEAVDISTNDDSGVADAKTNKAVGATGVAADKNEDGIAGTSSSKSTGSLQNVDSIRSQLPKVVDVQSYQAEGFSNETDFRNALGDLNAFAQQHMNDIEATSDALTLLAERELAKSNEKSIKADTLSNAAEKHKAQQASKDYLYRAMAAKSLAEKYQAYAEVERSKQQNITEASFKIEKKLDAHQIEDAKALFQAMQDSVNQFGETNIVVLGQVNKQLLSEGESIKDRMDSAYSDSQTLANKAVMLLSQAAEERKEAQGKRNAFKRRELLKQAEDKEVQATIIQNESDKVLTAANALYEKNQLILALNKLEPEITQIVANGRTSGKTVAADVNQAVVFENIANRKEEVINGKLSTTAANPQDITATAHNQNPPVLATDDVHTYERENFRAQLISDELGILNREIALLVKTDRSQLNKKQTYVLDNQIKMYRQKADSLEYEANKAFELANLVLSSLSDDEQQKAKKKGRSFDDYLNDLKTRIESLLSEASSLKQRAQRSNNIDTRTSLYNQAKDKEEVAMYLILEEFEVIAQKNKTRYRNNQLILQQMLMENASLQERDLMQDIFTQIDSYFDQAKTKREKANAKGVSFNMRKILLQDAYSLEMKALDLQQKAKTMLENHDTASMMAYQKQESSQKNHQTIAEVQKEHRPSTPNTQSNITAQNHPQVSNTAQTTDKQAVAKNVSKKQEVEKSINLGSPSEQGTIYKVQFTAIPELKSAVSFKQVSEVTAERVPNSNFIRYFSGSFGQLDLAMIRRNSLRASGYPDAFIRTWKDGESISLLSLRADASNTPIATSPTIGPNLKAINYSATNISNLSGTYYSVQVGVYSRPRTSAMIYGISPLYHRRLSNGFWVYYSGIFKTIADASQKKDEIRGRGVSDAFVVAFSDGKPVSLAQARVDLSRGASVPQDEDVVILEDASQQIESEWNIAQTTNKVLPNNKARVYKVQIGVYSNRINMDWISSQLDGEYYIDVDQNANGKYVYSVGNFDNEQDARKLLNQVKELVPDAFISAFQGDLKIYIR